MLQMLSEQLTVWLPVHAPPAIQETSLAKLKAKLV
jgi:hypothetical protein